MTLITKICDASCQIDLENKTNVCLKRKTIIKLCGGIAKKTKSTSAGFKNKLRGNEVRAFLQKCVHVANRLDVLAPTGLEDERAILRALVSFKGRGSFET